jgi:hypothetical protein
MQVSVNVNETVPAGYEPVTLKRVATGEKFLLNGVVKTRTSRGLSNGYYLTVTAARRPVAGEDIDRDIEVNVRKNGVVSGQWERRRMVGFQKNGTVVVYRRSNGAIDTVPADRARKA